MEPDVRGVLEDHCPFKSTRHVRNMLIVWRLQEFDQAQFQEKPNGYL